jgi:hypothetical protein
MGISTLLAALQLVVAAAPDTTDAFEDAPAAELVGMVRQARATQQATLTGYSALAQERASVIARALDFRPGWRMTIAVDNVL